MTRTSLSQLARTFVSQLSGASKDERAALMQATAQMLVENGYGAQLDRFLHEVNRVIQADRGVAAVSVTVARKIDAKQLEAIESQVAKLLNVAKVQTTVTEDSSLIGGFIARTADAKIDASLQTKLTKLGAV